MSATSPTPIMDKALKLVDELIELAEDCLTEERLEIERPLLDRARRFVARPPGPRTDDPEPAQVVALAKERRTGFGLETDLLLEAIESGERDNNGLEALRLWLISDEVQYVPSMDGDALDALALRLFAAVVTPATPEDPK